MSVKSELDALRDSDGNITPVQVLAWAKDHPESAIYRSFEWDDSKASAGYKRLAARDDA